MVRDKIEANIQKADRGVLPSYIRKVSAGSGGSNMEALAATLAKQSIEASRQQETEDARRESARQEKEKAAKTRHGVSSPVKSQLEHENEMILRRLGPGGRYK